MGASVAARPASNGTVLDVEGIPRSDSKGTASCSGADRHVQGHANAAGGGVSPGREGGCWRGFTTMLASEERCRDVWMKIAGAGLVQSGDEELQCQV